jgi:hypothetical protein
VYIGQPYFRLLSRIHKPFVVTFFFELAELCIKGSFLFAQVIPPYIGCEHRVDGFCVVAYDLHEINVRKYEIIAGDDVIPPVRRKGW